MIFDFSQMLDSPSSIANIISVQIIVVSGDDPDPMNRLLSAPVLIDLLNTGMPEMAVEVLLGGMLADVVYLIRCTVDTMDGHQLMTEARWPCRVAT